MSKKQPYRVTTISEFHRIMGLKQPEHPLISVIDVAQLQPLAETDLEGFLYGFYSIALKKSLNAKFKYGQQKYDFDEGTMFFMSPNQLFGIERSEGELPEKSGWLLLIHPDFLWHTPLAKSIEQYEFFDYAVNEALFLSEKEQTILNGVVQNIQREYHSNIDHFSQNIIISQIETLLNYSDRFYQRQFITRKITNHQILDRLEKLLVDYFNDEDLIHQGLPTVKYISEQLNVSQNYLRGLLKVLTGQNTQQHIHDKLIERAKEKLSTTDLSVSEIAYSLGFEHPQSFSKLFKTRTNLTPLKFRQSFN